MLLRWRAEGFAVAATLYEMGHAVSANTVRKLLTDLGFSRQSNRKSEEGSHGGTSRFVRQTTLTRTKSERPITRPA